MARHNFLSKNKSEITNWLLLIDAGSVCSMIRYPSLLSDIRKTSKPLDLIANGGPFGACVKGMFMDKLLVWCSKESMVNLLGFSQLAIFFRIVCDAQFEEAMHANTGEDKWMKFTPFGAGLCACDARGKKCNSSKPEFLSYLLVQTVAENKLQFTPEEAHLAEEAHKLHARIGPMSNEDFSKMLKTNYIRNYSLTSKDSRRTMCAHGKNKIVLRGRSTKRVKPKNLAPTEVNVPKVVLEKIGPMRTHEEIMHVNGNPFFCTRHPTKFV